MHRNNRLHIAGYSTPGILSNIDAVSSVSGGSLASAYFVANAQKLLNSQPDSDEWRCYLDKMAISYRKREWDWMNILKPSVFFKLVFTNYNRGLLARDDYDKTLFHGATLADLPNRPAIYINSFDVANHVRFVFSKHYIDTTFFQSKDWWGKLNAPQEIASENDLSFCNLDPSSIRIADAVYASSAFPAAYPNFSVNHWGSKILFQGTKIFLADGGFADNSGLVSLLTQIRATMDEEAKGQLLLVIYIDASRENISTNGSKFQQEGREDTYAWRDTLIGHAMESIESGNTLVQDLTWKFVESTGVVTDQLNMNWPLVLKAKHTETAWNSKACWSDLCDRGVLLYRPCLIRLGLRDVANPDFPKRFLNNGDSRLQSLLRENHVKALGKFDPAPALPERLSAIKTDFALSQADRRALDLAAYLLVNGKLADDLEQWNSIVMTADEKQNSTP